MTELPTGTVTFLFTDIEGSTSLAQQFPAELPTLLAQHHAILHQAIQAHNGYVFQITGDAFCAAFYTASDALKSALDAQFALQQEVWDPAPIKVRMGIHTGSAQAGAIEERAGGYVGYLTLTRVQRVMSVAHGGQVLLSNPAAELVHGELPADIALRDMSEHRLKGLLNPEHLWQVVAPDMRQDFPPLQSLNAIPNNLPVQLTSFIGREKDIAEVKRLLSASRLVTLTGSGGAGKTRLSLQVAAEVIDDFPQGVWFVELAALTDPALIPQTVAAALGLREEQGRPLMTMLTDYLHTKTALIILDNCEHLIEGCAHFADTLLRAAPQIKILASSREALNIGGEATYRVPSLAAPDPQHVPSLEALTQYDAVRLFIERAKAVLPTFEVNDANAPAVAQLCYHLDGIPLALELAAARVRGLKVEQIAQRLDDRFRLLTGGGRTALPRHQTLRATIDWSHGLLTEQERILFRRLSVFAGGWTIEAAESVGADLRVGPEITGGRDADTRISPYDVLDLLTRLVDKSLILMDGHSAETRYHMLETIREYAWGRLQESDEGDHVQQQHLAYFLEFAQKDEPESLSDTENQWREQLEPELDNLRAALTWSLGNDSETGLRLAVTFGTLCRGGRDNDEAVEWLRKLLAQPGTSAHTSARAIALWSAGDLVSATDFDNESRRKRREYYEEALAICRELDEPFLVADGLRHLGLIGLLQYDFEMARPLLAESLNISQSLSDRYRAATVLRYLGLLTALQGDVMRARQLFEESLRNFQELGMRLASAKPLGNLGDVALYEGDLTRARSYCEETLALYREAGQEQLSYDWMLTLSEVAAREGKYEEAQTIIERHMAICQEYGWSNSLSGYNSSHLAFLARAQGDYQQSAELYKKCLSQLKNNPDKFTILRALEGTAGVSAMQGKARHAITLFGATAALQEALGIPAPPIYQADNERDIATARAQLDEAAFNAAWEAGRSMTLEQAIEFALTDGEET